MITDILNTVVTGIIAGVVSSATFHVILKRTVPKIKISDKIEKRIVNGQAKYHIKIVNLRRRFVVNVAPYLDLAHSENGPDGTILRLKNWIFIQKMFHILIHISGKIPNANMPFELNLLNN